jgi:hypothetical protein
MPGVPGVPVGGAGWAGVIFVVSRGSCARRVELTAQSVNSAPTTSVKLGALCFVE